MQRPAHGRDGGAMSGGRCGPGGHLSADGPSDLIASNPKRWLLGTHKGAPLPRHLPAYLNEFTFRFNRRFWRGPAFHRALGLIIQAEKWPEYDTLYSVAKGGVGAWVHPTSATNTRPKVRADGDKATTQDVGVA